MAKVKDVIKGRKVVTVGLECSIKKAGKILIEKKFTNLPVVDSSGRLRGVVSEKDIIKSFNFDDTSKKKVKDIMTKKVVYVKENDALERVAKIFIDKQLRKLPVVKNDKVIGVITRDDIISSFMKYY